MNLTELTAEVLNWCNRPDLTVEAQSAIRRTTLGLHRRHVWPRDINTATISNPGYSGSIAINSAQFTRFRGLRLISAPDRQLQLVELDDLYDLDGYKKDNVAWQAGTNINYLTSYNPSSLTIQYLSDPDIATATYYSWIADLQPDAIITAAVAALMSLKGENDIRSRAEVAAREEELALLTTYSSGILR